MSINLQKFTANMSDSRCLTSEERRLAEVREIMEGHLDDWKRYHDGEIGLPLFYEAEARRILVLLSRGQE